MARLHLLRRGSGEDRVVGSFEVSADRVRTLYESSRVQHSVGMPTINGDPPASRLLGSEVAVIELRDGEAIARFRSPGFNILVGADPRDAYRQLVEEAGG